MATLLLPFVVFLAVILVTWLSYTVLFRYFDPGGKAKKSRLRAIRNASHPDAQGAEASDRDLQERALETWLRSHSGTFVRLESLVRHAHSPLRAGRLLGLMLGLFALVMASGLLRQTNLPLLLALAVAVAGSPLLWLHRQSSQRSKNFGDKFPEAIDYISRALRAGHGLSSAIGMVGREFPGPVGHEFKIVFDEISFGIPFKEAVGKLADRIQSNDLNFFAVSLMIQHETGGNLAELLDGLAKTIRDRIKLRGKIRTLSSEGRISAWILGLLPFAVGAILLVVNPAYVSMLWTTPQGTTLLLIGGGLMGTGFFTLSRIVRFRY
jgi:tight adherence protein B